MTPENIAGQARIEIRLPYAVLKSLLNECREKNVPVEEVHSLVRQKVLSAVKCLEPEIHFEYKDNGSYFESIW